MLNFKKIQFNKMVYPALISLFFIAVIIIFIFAAKFLLNNFNRAFSIDDSEVESYLIRVDMDNFQLISRKLGFGNMAINTMPPASVIEAGAQTIPASDLASTSSVEMIVSTSTIPNSDAATDTLSR